MRMSLVAAVAGLLVTATVASASPVSGDWKTPVKGASIQLYDCGAEVCGRVLDSDDLRAHPDMRDVHNKDAALKGRMVKGSVIMTGFKGGPMQWTDGALYDPQSGSTYHGVITLETHDTLNLKGCIIGPLCRTQTWTRLR